MQYMRNTKKYIKIYGIVLIIFGSFYLIYGIISGLYEYITSNTLYLLQKTNMILPFLNKMDIKYHKLQSLVQTMILLRKIPLIYKLLSSLLSLISIISGIQLLKLKYLGKKLAQLWAINAILLIIADTALYFTVVQNTNSSLIQLFYSIAEKNEAVTGIINSGNVSISTLIQATSLYMTIKHVISGIILFILPTVTLLFVRQKDISKILKNNPVSQGEESINPLPLQ